MKACRFLVSEVQPLPVKISCVRAGVLAEEVDSPILLELTLTAFGFFFSITIHSFWHLSILILESSATELSVLRFVIYYGWE